jgi:hypothetical protein
MRADRAAARDDSSIRATVTGRPLRPAASADHPALTCNWSTSTKKTTPSAP